MSVAVELFGEGSRDLPPILQDHSYLGDWVRTVWIDNWMMGRENSQYRASNSFRRVQSLLP